MSEEITPLTIIWNKAAYFSLESACKYISKKSAANAEKVKLDILAKTANLGLNPEKYPLDKYKYKNSGNFRAFEKYRLRIAYKHTATEIRILRVRSTDQEPRKY